LVGGIARRGRSRCHRGGLPGRRQDVEEGLAGFDQLVVLAGQALHLGIRVELLALLGEQGIDDVVVTVGGTIPADDVEELKSLGVAEVFTPGAPTQAIVDFIRTATAGGRIPSP